MHTSVTELRAEGAGPVRIAIRLYADDLAGAVPVAGPAPADSAISRYLRGRFAIWDRRDTPVPLRWEGLAWRADAVVIRLEAAMPEGLAGARIANLVLTERFRDQVNVVRAVSPDATTTLLFIPGDGAKTLP
jgi:hypothetical protein